MNIIILIAVAIFFLGLIILAIGVAIHYSKVEKQMALSKSTTKYSNGGTTAVLKEARETIKKINSRCYSIEDPELIRQIRSITTKGSEIVRELKRNPEDIKKARKFLHYYLDATYNIVEKYEGLKGKNIASHENVLNQVGPILEDIQKGFDYEYAKLFDDDLMNLDVEIEVLRTTIEQETKGRI